VERLPLGWGWGMGALVVERGDGQWVGYGCSVWVRLGIGKGGVCAVCIECRMVP